MKHRNPRLKCRLEQDQFSDSLSVLFALVTDKNQKLATASGTIRDQISAITTKNEEVKSTNVQLIVARTDAEQKRDDAIKQKTRADAKAQEARRHLYSTRMNLVQRNWEYAHVDLVLDLLEKTRPQPGDTDLRGFEWYFWDGRCHSYQLDLNGDFAFYDIAFSPDGKRLASTDIGSVTLWDKRQHRHVAPVTLIAPPRRYMPLQRVRSCPSHAPR